MSTAQLHAVGLGRGAIHHRVRQGRLHQIHRGVYAVGHARLTFRGRLWAAILACGGPEVAVISYACAAAIWDLRGVPSGPVEVTTLVGARSTTGIRVHESTLPPAVTYHDGLPVTSVARTLVDLAAVVSPDQLARLCRQALFHRLLDVGEVEALAAGRRGAKALRQAIATLTETGPELTRSDAEDRFLALVARHGLPMPLVNRHVLGHTVDFYWPAQRLVVEIDGAQAHLTRSAFENDRRRDAHLIAHGITVVRYTFLRLTREPDAIAAELGAQFWGTAQMSSALAAHAP